MRACNDITLIKAGHDAGLEPAQLQPRDDAAHAETHTTFMQTVHTHVTAGHCISVMHLTLLHDLTANWPRPWPQTVCSASSIHEN